MDNKSFIDELAKLRPSSTFLSIKGYENSQQEIADYMIVFHVSYKSLLERSITQLEVYIPEDELELTAKQDLLKSYRSSLEKMEQQPQEELEDAYQHFKDEGGNYIKGVKLHKDSNTVHMYGLVVNKTVIQAGSYKEVKSKTLTLAKNKLTKELPISKWRQFKMTPNQVNSISVEKLTIKL